MQTTKPNAGNVTAQLTTTFVRARLTDRPGELGRSARILAEAGINLEGFNCDANGVKFLVSNPGHAVEILRNNELDAETVELFAIRLANQPGQLARIGEELGKAGVNIETCFGVAGTRENGRIFIECDDAALARPVIERLASIPTATQNPSLY